MDAQQERYLAGALHLYNEIEKDTTDHEIITGNWYRLKEIYKDIETHGPSTDKDEKVARVLVTLNRITEQRHHKSFDIYCLECSLIPISHIMDIDIENTGEVQITEIHPLTEVDKKKTIPDTFVYVPAEQIRDFIFCAERYIMALQPKVHNAKDAFEFAKIPPIEGMNVYEALQQFSHEHMSSKYKLEMAANTDLLEIRVKLSSLNQKISEINPSFQSFCLDIKKTGKPKNKTQEDLTNRLPILLSEVISTRNSIISFIKKNFPDENTSLNAISQ